MPGWDELWELASGQDGLFHVRDALASGVSDNALYSSRLVERVAGFRGVYRFRQTVAGRWHLYTTAFVWSRGEGVISHGCHRPGYLIAASSAELIALSSPELIALSSPELIARTYAGEQP